MGEPNNISQNRAERPADRPSFEPYKVHPVAAKFPLMEGEDFDHFVDDLRARGLDKPIKLLADEVTIVEGRNRFLGCRAAGIEPLFDVLPADITEEEVVAIIVSSNLQRVHLTTSQRAMIGAEIETWYAVQARQRQVRHLRRGNRERSVTPVGRKSVQRGNGGRAAEQAAKDVSVSPDSVRAAKKLTQEAPELAEEVRAGRVSLSRASRQVRQAKGDHGTSKPKSRRYRKATSKAAPRSSRRRPSARGREGVGFDELMDQLDHLDEIIDQVILSPNQAQQVSSRLRAVADAVEGNANGSVVTRSPSTTTPSPWDRRPDDKTIRVAGQHRGQTSCSCLDCGEVRGWNRRHPEDPIKL
jgi:hypothetical protein